MKTVALLLDDRRNLYQQLLVREANACAHRVGVTVLDPEFAEGSSWSQIESINTLLRHSPRPDALLLMLAGEQSTRTSFERVVKAGVALAFLNRIPPWTEELRKLFPTAFVASISPHQTKIGELQARQAIRLTQRNGFIILVTGAAASATAIARRRGFVETVRDHCVIHELDGRWSSQEAEKALSEWFRLGVDRNRSIDLIVCQNDAMASGVHKALAARAAATGRPGHGRVPVIGCDGLREEGQVMVAEKKLVATVVIPPTTPTALEMMRRYWDSGVVPGSAQLDVALYP